MNNFDKASLWMTKHWWTTYFPVVIAFVLLAVLVTGWFLVPEYIFIAWAVYANAKGRKLREKQNRAFYDK